MSAIGVTGAIVAGVALGVGIGIYISKQNQSSEKNKERNKEKESFEKKSVSDGSEPKNNSETAKENVRTNSTPVARVIMRNNANHFVDLLEPMYMVSKKQITRDDAINVFDEWNNRISNLENAEKLIARWNIITGDYNQATEDSISNLAFRWITQLASFGICRDDRDEIQVNAEAVNSYNMGSKEALALGETMYVKTPAWFIDNDLLRQGVLVKEKI